MTGGLGGGSPSSQPSFLSRVVPFCYKHGLSFLAEALANFILPYLIYISAKSDLGEAGALLVSSLPPIAWSVIEFARNRRVDALSVFVLAGIMLSLLAFVGGGSVRVLQLRENLVSAVVALILLGSVAIGRPLMMELVRAVLTRKSAAQAALFEQASLHPHVRAAMATMTLIWGFGLLAQAGLACVLVYAMSIETYLLVGPIFGYGALGVLILCTFVYARRQRRLGDAIRRDQGPS
jgi:hypothetical protein